MAAKFNHRRSSLLLVGLSIAVFLTSLLIVDGQSYYNPYPYNNPQTGFEQAGIARAYQNLYNSEYYNPYPYNNPQTGFEQAGIARAYQNLYNSEYYNPYSYNNDPQAALDLMDIARANQRLYNYDSSDWEYWANLYLNAPYY